MNNKESIVNMEYIDHIVSHKLKYYRKSLGLSLNQVATVAGVSVQQILKYENCQNRVPISRLYYIAKLMTVSINYFVDKKNYKHANKKPDTKDHIK